MEIIEQSWEWMQPPPENAVQLIEKAGRTCYKSEDKITAESAEKFVKMLIKSGHLSVIEHIVASVKIVTDRGVTHELVRHRLASYSQESTRYCNYRGGLTFIKPYWFDSADGKMKDAFLVELSNIEQVYVDLVCNGLQPQAARDVLPNSLKTEIVMTANLREWMHVFKLRCSKAAHPQIRLLMRSIRAGFAERLPAIFPKEAY